MAIILNIETATKNCSVAVAKDGQVLSCLEIATEGYSHAEKLHVFIEKVLGDTNLSYRDLSAVAVSKGPGSYTGLRIGVSAAKGLCFALDIPLISIGTLAVLASQTRIDGGLIVPMLDARRMEVYSAIFNHNMDLVRDVLAEIITKDTFASTTKDMYIVGDCQDKVKAVLKKANIRFLADVVFPSANDMVALSFEKFRIGDFEDVAYFEPLYLKDFMVVAPKK